MTLSCFVCASTEDLTQIDDDTAVCRACARVPALSISRTEESFTELAERVAQLTSQRTPAVGGSAERVFRERVETLSQLVNAKEAAVESPNNLGLQEFGRWPTADKVYQLDLQRLLDTGEYGMDFWLVECDPTPLVAYCVENPHTSLLQVIDECFGKGQTASQVFGGTAYTLFGTLPPSQLLELPWRDPRW